ncbi:ketoacyl reductase [Enemella evansiae]|uniref:SDR family NAD(P)-dependent oxidoreductase n=1 Tax=Enemella evansiae TaxID=2016499 RepID=UPI000B972A69|nr:SDR family NAD(P)-dependent oxidoreductase [Enemella evansiae]OYO15476.1 ketoacyl reductase [Enemella evansiae]
MTTPSKVALVTGGTSGIGLSVAERFAADGVPVAVCARDADAVDQTAQTLQSLGVQAIGIRCDVRDTHSVDAAVDQACDVLGPVSILVNNAGRGGGGVTREVSDALWADVIETNLSGTFRVTRSVLAAGGMDSGWGRILNIASTGGKQGVALAAPYSAAKGGVIAFTKALAWEVAEAGITVNAICPGYVETPMAVGVRQRFAAHWEVSEEEVLARFNAKIPLGRYSTPGEVAGLAGYLLSDEAASMTGQALNVCGGLGKF